MRGEMNNEVTKESVTVDYNWETWNCGTIYHLNKQLSRLQLNVLTLLPIQQHIVYYHYGAAFLPATNTSMEVGKLATSEILKV